MNHPRLLWALVLALAIASAWLARRAPAPAADPVTREAREVDYRLSGLRVLTFSPEGRPARTLEVAALRHYGDDGTARLERPRLTVHRDPAPAWTVRSEAGWVSADGGLILLEGAVRIERAATNDRPALRIDTRELRVQPREDYAETDEAVRLRSGADRLTATGLQAWLRRPARLKLLNEVKGYHAPP